jgi:hypothetical protein
LSEVRSVLEVERSKKFAVVVVARENEDTFARIVESLAYSEFICAYRVLEDDVNELAKVLEEFHKRIKREVKSRE